MPITGSAERCALSVYDWAELPDGALALLDAAGANEFMFGSAWFGNVVANGLLETARACFAVCTSGYGTEAVFPMRWDGPALSALTTPYTCLYAPLLAAGIDSETERAIFGAFGQFCRSWPTVQMNAMPADWPHMAAFRAGLRRARLVPLAFDHFGNWYENVAGVGWDAYLAARPSELRQTILRRQKRADADPSWSIAITENEDGLDDAVAAFEAIYARSWKEPEPFPRFNAGLIRVAAHAEFLRLGVLRIGGAPAATQLWISEPNGRATVHKLAHDETYKSASPGTVLAAAMIRRLLERDRVRELDYGRGDDAYKRMWTRERRQRIGVVIANPMRPAGAVAVARHAAARAMRAARAALARGET